MSRRRLKLSRKFRGLIHALVNAVIYNIWHSRNRKLSNDTTFPAPEVWSDINRQATLRVLQLQQCSKHYSSCVDFLQHRFLKVFSYEMKKGVYTYAIPVNEIPFFSAKIYIY